MKKLTKQLLAALMLAALLTTAIALPAVAEAGTDVGLPAEIAGRRMTYFLWTDEGETLCINADGTFTIEGFGGEPSGDEVDAVTTARYVGAIDSVQQVSEHVYAMHVATFENEHGEAFMAEDIFAADVTVYLVLPDAASGELDGEFIPTFDQEYNEGEGYYEPTICYVGSAKLGSMFYYPVE